MTISVKELRDALVEADDNLTVILSKDAEGNGYSPLSSCESAQYIPENTWSGELQCLEYDEDEDYLEEDGPKSISAIVLYPTG